MKFLYVDTMDYSNDDINYVFGFVHKDASNFIETLVYDTMNW